MKLQYFISILLITYSCIQPNNGLYNIDPRDFNERKITLSDIAKDITYIPLDNSIPFTNFKYILTSDYYYISAKGIGILKFDRNGRLIQKIGDRGEALANSLRDRLCR